MRYVAAYLLAALGGNNSPSSKDIKSILSSVGIDADDTSLNKVITEMKGKTVEEVIAAGKGKLASVPSGGSTASVAATGSVEAPVAKVEEKKEESEEESDDDMGFGLFD